MLEHLSSSLYYTALRPSFVDRFVSFSEDSGGTAVHLPCMRKRILLVYNADGGVRGEIVYFLKKGLGIAKCELCTITHRGLSERDPWRECRRGIDADVVGLHRNELSDAERRFIAGRYPCVVSDDAGELVMVLGPESFGPLMGDPKKLANAIHEHLGTAG